MGNEALVTESVLCLLEMVGRRCGRLRQPGMRHLGVGWAGARQGTMGCGGGTGKEVVQNDEGVNKG